MVCASKFFKFVCNPHSIPCALMSIFSILNHPCSFMVYNYLWCFSILVNFYFQVSLSLKVNLYVGENNSK